MNIFHRYVVRELSAPFVFSFSVIMFILILKLMLQLMDLLITKGVGIVVMAKLFIYNMPWMIALVVPMSVLVATLMAFGRMGAYGEITAMKSAGISMYRIVSPVILLSIALTIFMIWFNNSVLPAANLRAKNLRMAIAYKQPMLSLKNREGQFITDLPGIAIRVNEIDYATMDMYGVTLFKQEDKTFDTTIIAERGRFETYPSGDRLALILYNGEIHRTQERENRYIRSIFNEFRQLINVNFGLDTSQKAMPDDRSKTSVIMWEDIHRMENRIDQYHKAIEKTRQEHPERKTDIERYKDLIKNNKTRINTYLIEIHKKNSIPVAAVIFALIGSALGILVKRSGATIGIGLSIGFFTLYYLFLIGGEDIGDRMLMPPWLSMWLPNIIFGALGIALIVHANRK